LAISKPCGGSGNLSGTLESLVDPVLVLPSSFFYIVGEDSSYEL